MQRQENDVPEMVPINMDDWTKQTQAQYMNLRRQFGPEEFIILGHRVDDDGNMAVDLNK